MNWNPKSLSPHVTNLELWLLAAVGFVLGKWGQRFSGIVFVAIIFGAYPFVRWWRGHCGLDQWPEPYGRYYRQWLAAKSVGDYYPWLAKQMGGRSPWREWVALEADLPPD